MEIPRHWRLNQQRYRLMGTVCLNCENKIFPPRDICPRCGKDVKKAESEQSIKNILEVEVSV
jgi:uncharacterized OB-fold protein